MTGNAFERHTIEDFAKHPLAELRKKRFMANLCIRVAQEGGEEGERALEHYRAERASINGAIREKLYPDGPPAQEIGLKTLSVAGNASARKKTHTGNLIGAWLKLWEKRNGRG